MNMKQSVIIFALLLAGLMPAKAQNDETMNRIETCKENYRTLFGGEALTGQGTDPEMTHRQVRSATPPPPSSVLGA